MHVLPTLVCILGALAGLLPVPGQAAAGCNWYDGFPALCRLHPRCWYNESASSCRSPSMLCAQRPGQEVCEKTLDCRWDMSSHTCEAASSTVSHSWFSACRGREPLVYEIGTDAVRRCLRPEESTTVHCQWDVTRHVCAPRYQVLCPQLTSHVQCDRTMGCVWRAFPQPGCVGLTADNTDCSAWDYDRQQCDASATCEWKGNAHCAPRVAAAESVDMGWRRACNTDFAEGYGTACPFSDSQCTRACSWQQGCVSTALDLTYPGDPLTLPCDVSPGYGGCQVAHTLADCGRIHNGGCQWQHAQNRCVAAPSWTSSVRMASHIPRTEGHTLAWMLGVVVLGFLVALVLLANLCCVGTKNTRVRAPPDLSRVRRGKPRRSKRR